MPNYKYGQFFATNGAQTFDQTYHPGALTPVSGIYRCGTCGYEAVSTQGHHLPPTVSCEHHSSAWVCRAGRTVWRLVAAAIHTNKN